MSKQSLSQLAKITGLSVEVLKEMQAKEAAKNPKKQLPQGIKAQGPCTAVTGEYEGKPTITLQRGESSFINRPFTFGKAKAQMIVEQYEAIKSFAESK